MTIHCVVCDKVLSPWQSWCCSKQHYAVYRNLLGYNTRNYIKWRAKIVKEARRCSECKGKPNKGRLELHHVIPISWRNKDRLLQDKNNVVVLCTKHHAEKHNKFRLPPSLKEQGVAGKTIQTLLDKYKPRWTLYVHNILNPSCRRKRPAHPQRNLVSTKAPVLLVEHEEWLKKKRGI